MEKLTFNEEGLSPTEKGRQRYQEKDYAGAIEAFTEAVNISTDYLLFEALDKRAATYVKLDELQLALRDAKRMIELKPALSKGYLRCGDVLKLKRENSLALKIYERGLAKVPINTDKERLLLHTKYNKLRDTLNMRKCRDPLQHLPLELAQMVCQFLEMRDRAICLAVSKSWKKLLESSPRLWTTLDTTSSKKFVSQKSLKAHLKRSKYTLERAFISMRTFIDGDKMKYLTRTCSNLQEIRISGSGMLGDSLTGALPTAKALKILAVAGNTEISLSSLQSALRICSATLEETSFFNVEGSKSGFLANRWPMMKSLKKILLIADGDSCLDLHGLRDNTPNLTTVILRNWKVSNMIDLTLWTSLKILDLRNTGLKLFPKLPPSLTELYIDDNFQIQTFADDALPMLPLLEVFSCAYTFLDGRVIKEVTKESIKNKSLKRLYVGGRVHDWRATSVDDEFPACETLEEISLSNLHLTDRHAVLIVKLYPNLKTLDVSATQISGVAVKEFVAHGIMNLTLNDCNGIGLDAVDWARGQGIQVTQVFRSAGRLNGGRRFAESAFARGF